MIRAHSKDDVRAEALKYRERANALSLRALGLKRGETRLLMLQTALTFERMAEALEFEAAA